MIMESCPNCGAYVENGDNYCGKCRFELITEKIVPQLTHQEIKVDEVRNNLAHVYFKMGKFKLALEIFKKNLVINPNDDHAIRMIEIIKEEQKKASNG
jgi:tetratricopeptide (TPR) repeat protein